MALKATKNPVLSFNFDGSTTGRISFNDGLTFNFELQYGHINLYRSQKLPNVARLFKSQNHERAALRFLNVA